MKLPLLALLGMMTTGCGAIRTVYVAPATPSVVVEVAPAYAYIEYHYVYVNTQWVRRSGPPPRGVRYHRHPTHSRSVIVQRSTSYRPPARTSYRRPTNRTTTTQRHSTSGRSSNSRSAHTKDRKRGRSTHRR
jgi:hypothetical protein